MVDVSDPSSVSVVGNLQDYVQALAEYSVNSNTFLYATGDLLSLSKRNGTSYGLAYFDTSSNGPWTLAGLSTLLFNCFTGGISRILTN